ncbi:MAG: GIY-YIG nuclease family protein, partial [Pseudohongiella sp.]|nr:GIY-YIG nuclease family protein [Pseudohongiella sp.]
RWELRNQSIYALLTDMSSASPALYAFVIDGTVHYVGKTSRTLGHRLYGYAKGGSTQRTNIRVRALILESLTLGNMVEIYGFSDSQPQDIGRFVLDKSAGLEDDIIRQLQPRWNGRGSFKTLGYVAKSEHTHNQTVVNSAHKNAVIKSSSNTQATTSEAHFSCKIGATYFRQGFFNVPSRFSHLFGEHGQAITIQLPGTDAAIGAKINRTANVSNGAPRIMAGAALRDWFNNSISEGDTVEVTVLQPDLISLRADNDS